jgi:hypothetical protein
MVGFGSTDCFGGCGWLLLRMEKKSRGAGVGVGVGVVPSSLKTDFFCARARALFKKKSLCFTLVTGHSRSTK